MEEEARAAKRAAGTAMMAYSLILYSCDCANARLLTFFDMVHGFVLYQRKRKSTRLADSAR
jgi:hypothetical protein